jgi:hypothetical protein
MLIFSDKLNVSEESIRDVIETIMFIVTQSSKLSVSLSINCLHKRIEYGLNSILTLITIQIKF